MATLTHCAARAEPLLRSNPVLAERLIAAVRTAVAAPSSEVKSDFCWLAASARLSGEPRSSRGARSDGRRILRRYFRPPKDPRAIWVRESPCSPSPEPSRPGSWAASVGGRRARGRSAAGAQGDIPCGRPRPLSSRGDGITTGSKGFGAR